MTQKNKQTQFPTTSSFHPDSEDWSQVPDSLKQLGQRTTSCPAQVTEQQVEDWVYRLRSCADEASDENLHALESDLLDIREELAHLLS